MDGNDRAVDDANSWLALCTLLGTDRCAPEDVARDVALAKMVRRMPRGSTLKVDDGGEWYAISLRLMSKAPTPERALAIVLEEESDDANGTA